MLSAASQLVFFSLSYYYAGIYIFSCIALLILYPTNYIIWLSATPLFISILLPPIASPSLLKTYFFRCMLSYFDFEHIDETSYEEIQEIEKTKRIIYTAQPHGVMSFCGMCYGVVAASEGKKLAPTAAASVILQIPILKQVIGLYGLVDASKKSLVKCLTKRKSSVVLYIGGIAELFLSNPNEEKLHLKDRKGFIKLAMTTGSEIIPFYFLGNTSGLKILQGKFLSTLSRKIGVSITWTYGRWGLPIPLPDKMVSITGRPLGIPKIENPTNEDIEKWHAKYVEEVTRLFEKYKAGHPNYCNKKLVVV
mmetsp:Transcript_22566/g.29293  ORF Transcript_22566/g.29293 Transcript_22566/m.29293 type:complete len:307 (+) Transcript_22566:26-946(+)